MTLLVALYILIGLWPVFSAWKQSGWPYDELLTNLITGVATVLFWPLMLFDVSLWWMWRWPFNKNTDD